MPTLDFISSIDGDGVNRLNVVEACPDDASEWPATAAAVVVVV